MASCTAQMRAHSRKAWARDDGAVPHGELDRLEREMARARSGPADEYADVLERVLVACGADPRAAEYFDVLETHSELAKAYDRLGEVEKALEHADVLAAAGYNCRPDPRCRRAEILTRAGRVEEAATIWADVARETPEDVWVYNNAGLEYGAIGDHETALSWLTRALERAVSSGDPERLLDQLRELRAASLTALGREPDALQTAAVVEHSPPPQPAASAREIETAYRESGMLSTSWAWLPASEYAAVREHWPDIVDSQLLRDADGGLVDHREYCRRMERRLRAASEAGVQAMRVAPIRWDEFGRWMEETQPEVDEPRQLRAQFAAVLGRDPARVNPWPPGRNQECWCGSGRKYKKCCAAPGRDGSP